MLRIAPPLWMVLIAATGCGRAPATHVPVVDPEILHDAVHQLTGVIVHDIFSPPGPHGHTHTRASPLMKPSGTITRNTGASLAS